MVEPGTVPVHNYSCTQMQEDALALLGSELTDEQERQVMIHLATCKHCRQEFRRDRLIMRSLSACPSITAGPSFEAELMQRIAQENIKVPNTKAPATSGIEKANERSDVTTNPASPTPKPSTRKEAPKKPT